MKQRPSAKAAETPRSMQTPASIRPGGPPATVHSQFVIRLPLGPEQEQIPPSGEQDSPAWQLFYNFLEILSGISHEVPEMAESGLLTFEIEAGYRNAPPGVIPDDEVGPLGGLLKQNLLGVIREESTDVRPIIEESPSKQGLLKIAAKFCGDPGVISSVVEALQEIDVDRDLTGFRIRADALGHLHRVGPKAVAARPELLTLLGAADPGVRIHAALALKIIGSTDASMVIPVLAELLKHPDFTIVHGATEALAVWGPDAKAAVPALIDLLKERNAYSLVWVATVLAEIGDAAKAAGPELFRWAIEQNTTTKPYLTAKKTAQEVLKVIHGLGNIDINYTLYDNYNDFVNDLETHGRLMETKEEALAQYKKTAEQLAGMSHEFREKLAAELGPVLNRTIQTMEQGTLEEKKAICDFVNGELEPLGLAVQCPNTDGLPGKLKASSGNWPGVGSFYFEVYVDGKRKQPAYSDTLPKLVLVDAYPPKERDTHFQDVVGPKSTRTGRKLT